MFRVIADMFKSKGQKDLEELKSISEDMTHERMDAKVANKEILGYLGLDILSKTLKDESKAALKAIPVIRRSIIRQNGIGQVVEDRRTRGTGLSFLSLLYDCITSQIKGARLPPGFIFEYSDANPKALIPIITPGMMTDENYNKFVSIIKKLKLLIGNHFFKVRRMNNCIAIDNKYTHDMMKIDRSKIIDFFKEKAQPVE